MKAHSFTLILDGEDVLDEAALEALYEGSCDDATFGEQDGVVFADFDRTSASFETAILAAIDDVEIAAKGIQVVRVQQPILATASDIATRVGRTRESVRMLIAGERGPGGFPVPVSRIGKSDFWRWTDVVSWFSTYQQDAVPSVAETTFIEAINGALQLRHYGHPLTPRIQGQLATWIDAHFACSLTTDPHAGVPAI
ncbi:MAG: hypothetical protein ACR2JC_19710 [Chloroflexota bacterium]|nr:MAG: hypothetical protein DLM70_18595 [Chloroflexota bacterium]